MPRGMHGHAFSKFLVGIAWGGQWLGLEATAPHGWAQRGAECKCLGQIECLKMHWVLEHDVRTCLTGLWDAGHVCSLPFCAWVEFRARRAYGRAGRGLQGAQLVNLGDVKCSGC